MGAKISNCSYFAEDEAANGRCDAMKEAAALLAAVFMLALCACRAPDAARPPAPKAVEQPEAGSSPVEENDKEGETEMKYDFSEFENVEITGAEFSTLTDEELAVLYRQARYCQAMTDADIDVMREIVSEDMIFVHMSGKRQSREEYFADVAGGSLDYYTIGIEDPVIEVNGDSALIAYTSVLNASAYGARGTYRMAGTHCYEKRGGEWIAVNR